MTKLNDESKSTLYLRMAILAAVIFFAEYFIMVTLEFSSKLPVSLLGLIDSLILLSIIFPVLYFFVFKPFHDKIEEANITRDENYLVLAELDQIFNTAASAMRVVDTDFNVTRVNQAFLDLVGVSEDQCIGKKCYDTFAGPACHTASCTLVRVVEGDKRVEYECKKQTLSGKKIPCIIVATPFKRPDGKIIGIVEDFRDITKQKNAEQVIRHQATHDPLTGLANRMFFNEHLSRMVMNMYRSRQKLCVMFMDLNKFKQVNDNYGHVVGDKLLIEVAKRLTSCIRKEDIVARLGGDEFTLILPHISGKEDAVKVAGKIAEVINSPCIIDGNTIDIRASIGMAVFPDDGEDVKTLMTHADSAMYRAKETGNSFELYQPESPMGQSSATAVIN